MIYKDQIDWQEVYNIQPIYVDKCWEHCNSYCCHTRSPHFDFRLMRPESAGLIYAKSEWDWCVASGKMQVGFQESARGIDFLITPGRSLRIVTTYCSLDGKCTFPSYRPLLCRLYPYFPRLDLRTNTIRGGVNASALDQYWDALKLEHPCWLQRTHGEKVLQELEQYLPLIIKYPALAFYFKAFELTADHLLQDILQSHPQLFSLTPQDFFRKWEMLYLMGRAFNKDELRAQLGDVDKEISTLYGKYEL